MEEAIEILTRMLIEEHIKGDKKVLTMTKENLYRFCIRLLKIIDLNK